MTVSASLPNPCLGRIYLRCSREVSETNKLSHSEESDGLLVQESAVWVSHLIFLGEETGGLERGALAMVVHLCDSGRTWAPSPGGNLLGTGHREHSNQQPEKEKGLFVIQASSGWTDS